MSTRTGDRRASPMRRLWVDVLAPRGWRTDLPVAVLTLALGIGFAVTIHTERSATGLTSARPDDLVAILAELSTRDSQLQQGISQLQTENRALTSGDPGVALAAARQRAEQLGILAGTLGAQGPGIAVTITDPRSSVGADTLVDALEELRDAGAEAIDLSGVRIVTQSYVTDGAAGGLDVDGVAVQPPYTLTAIGDPQTLAEALDIPGGVVDAVAASPGARASVASRAQVRITSLAAPAADRYAQPQP